jgi:hypothetical protein
MKKGRYLRSARSQSQELLQEGLESQGVAKTIDYFLMGRMKLPYT